MRAVYTQNGTGHGLVSVMNAARRGPMYGLMMMNDTHMLILRVLS